MESIPCFLATKSNKLIIFKLTILKKIFWYFNFNSSPLLWCIHTFRILIFIS